MKPIPWRRWLHIAMRLGVAPEAFWRLSVTEWRALLEMATLPYALPWLMTCRPEKHGTDR